MRKVLQGCWSRGLRRRPLLQTSSPLKTKKPENSHYDWYSEWGHFMTLLLNEILSDRRTKRHYRINKLIDCTSNGIVTNKLSGAGSSSGRIAVGANQRRRGPDMADFTSEHIDILNPVYNLRMRSSRPNPANITEAISKADG